MRNFSYSIALIALLTTACSEENGQEADQLLNGTTWGYSYCETTPTTQYPSEGGAIFGEILSRLEKLFQIEYFCSPLGKEVEEYTDWSEFKETTSLKFRDSKCYMTTKSEKSGKTTVVTKEQELLTFAAKIYTDNAGGILTVEYDGIYYKNKYEEERKIIELNNFTVKRQIDSSTEGIEISEEEKTLDLTMSYTRDNNNIVMSNEECKYVGCLNLEEKTIILYMLLPTVGEEMKFELVSENKTSSF